MARKFSLNKKPRPPVPRRRRSRDYFKTARAAFKRALDDKLGPHGGASAVRRIDPKTGLIGVIDPRSTELLKGERW